jgi:hypothetical protein
MLQHNLKQAVNCPNDLRELFVLIPLVGMQINSTVEWHFLSPQLGNTVGCSSPLQPHGSACLRSLLDDYQSVVIN